MGTGLVRDIPGIVDRPGLLFLTLGLGREVSSREMGHSMEYGALP